MNVHYKLLVTTLSLFSMGILPTSVNASNAEDIQLRVQKVGKLNIAEGAAMTGDTAESGTSGASAAPADPAAAYQSGCFACHGTGAAGAPVLGDTAAWSARIAQGEAMLVDHAINGLNAMPPRGGTTLDDETLKAVVVYMIENSQ